VTAINWSARWRLGGWWEDIYLGRKRFPIGPRNTWSNAAYLLAAAYLALTGTGNTRWVLAAGMVVLAIGSAAYHSQKTEATRAWDWVGMGATMATFTVHGALYTSPGLALGAFSVSVVAGSLLAWGQKSDLVLGLLFVAAAIPPMLHGNLWPALEAVGLFAVAMLFWQADKRRWAWVGLWGHALWHVFTAVAMPQLHQAQIR
jgi:predicted membrane channel-forming protein YqfA (hemolysin III family)